MMRERARGDDPPGEERRVMDADGVLQRVASEGLDELAEHGELAPAEQGLLELLTAFGDAVPGADRAAEHLRKGDWGDHRKRWSIRAGGPR